MTRKEAIEVVKERLDYYEREKRLKAACEILIPELAESEDEKIRKEIIGYLNNRVATAEETELLYFKRWITYLENQKEQKPIKVLYIPKFREGDVVVSKNNSRLTYQILEVGNINELGNPEYKVEIFTDGKSDEPRNIKYIEVAKMDNWGELIEQKPAEWSDTDMKEARYDLISVCMDWERGKQTTLLPIAAVRARYFLEHLTEPKPAEWSEEDEAFLRVAIAICNKYSHKDIADWLKSLRPQPHWKPSEEQMYILNWVANILLSHDGIVEEEAAKKLQSLHNDLKKL